MNRRRCQNFLNIVIGIIKKRSVLPEVFKDILDFAQVQWQNWLCDLRLLDFSDEQFTTVSIVMTRLTLQCSRKSPSVVCLQDFSPFGSGCKDVVLSFDTSLEIVEALLSHSCKKFHYLWLIFSFTYQFWPLDSMWNISLFLTSPLAMSLQILGITEN